MTIIISAAKINKNDSDSESNEDEYLDDVDDLSNVNSQKILFRKRMTKMKTDVFTL